MAIQYCYTGPRGDKDKMNNGTHKALPITDGGFGGVIQNLSKDWQAAVGELWAGTQNPGHIQNIQNNTTIISAIPPNPDPTNPSHYKLDSGRESIDILQDILSPEEFRGFLRGNIFKYEIRYRNKNGVEDLRKAAWYMDKLISVESEVSLNTD